MNKRNLLRFALAGGAGLCLPHLGITQVIDINDAINKAGRQRMLSQRVAKSYMALGQHVEAGPSEKILSLSMALFDRQLVELKSFAPNADIKTSYVQLESAWSDYKTALVGNAPGKSGAEQVLGLSARVLQLAHQGTVQLETHSGKPVGKLVNMAGRQRMLSQRMAALYLSASWGVQAAQSVQNIAKARDEFLTAHEVLKSAPEASAAIQSELQLAQSQFTFFEAALKTLQPGVASPTAQANVFTTSERILQVMDNVTGMYSKLI
jgi:hypothetical protein